ncbi:tetratricopeptide repeat protein [Clostridium tetanomorphum]|uniref:Tetratricopeptide repeat protein n=1 Tax=Clostridium tetanomorphum TaxID=1553 RepID=A0A923E511_CLOTT|nr:hypothetical protein [Clostridium tetanomorphum]MBC2396463.1 hypothetical protein [Clostridium tetanomorphum]NRZ98081.1 tetratricopeptide (TPR) repeat protein [Clostridium tetanomorphum]
MSNSIKHSIKNYQKIILEKYQTGIIEENYKERILKEIEGREALQNYFNEYIEKNKEALDLEWGCLMFLFIKASQEKNVTDVEEYSKKLNKYEDNYYIEYILGDISLMYYGDIFQAKDRFSKALTIKNNDSNCYYNLGFIYSLLGVFEKSLEYYNKAIYYSDNSVNPKDLKVTALHNVAVHYITVEEDYERAEEILEGILKEYPDYDKARATLTNLKGDA